MEFAKEIFKNEVRAAYLRACGIIKSPEIENALIARAKRGDRAARNLLFEKQLPALLDMANHSKYGVYRGNAAELVSSVMGIMDRAIELFDPTRGLRFWTFLRSHAFNAMNKESYEDSLIHVPENYVKANRRGEVASVESGDTAVGKKDGVTVTRFDLMAGDDGNETVFGRLVEREQEGIAGRLLTALEKDEQYVVEKCYLEDEPDEAGNPGSRPWSAASVARFTGSSKECINRIRKAALAKMRKALDADRDWCIDQSV